MSVSKEELISELERVRDELLMVQSAYPDELDDDDDETDEEYDARMRREEEEYIRELVESGEYYECGYTDRMKCSGVDSRCECEYGGYTEDKLTIYKRHNREWLCPPCARDRQNAIDYCNKFRTICLWLRKHQPNFDVGGVGGNPDQNINLSFQAFNLVMEENDWDTTRPNLENQYNTKLIELQT